MTHSRVAWSSLVVWRRMGTPALLTRQSRWPKASQASSATRPAQLHVGEVRHPQPRVGAIALGSRRAPRRDAASRRATRPTVAPRRARIRARAAPIPDDAPVTSTRDPSIFMGASSGSRASVQDTASQVEHDHGHPRRDPALLGRRRRHLRRRPRPPPHQPGGAGGVDRPRSRRCCPPARRGSSTAGRARASSA